MYNLAINLSTVIVLFIFLTGCSDNKPDKPALSDDTREWVSEAYKKIDYTQIRSTFNAERLLIIRKNLDEAKDPADQLNLSVDYALELLKCGKIKESVERIGSILNYVKENQVQIDAETKHTLYSLVGIAYLRYGEIENCVQHHNHESCFLPIQEGGIHQLPFGSTKAIEQYKIGLQEFPGELEFQYLLNIAYMTLGKYPEEVPKEYLINPQWFASKINFPRYKDIAAEIGVNRNSLAGGVVLDDFTNDGWLDMVVTSWGEHEELIFYQNNGDGTFSNKTQEFGLDGQVGVLNLNQMDFNNDGWLDLFLMRGGWYQTQGDIPNTLLMNTGKGSFVDVTLKAGMTKFGPTQTSAWADYNLDGWIDVLVPNESQPGYERGIDLYINQHDGTFKNESAAYGLTANQFYKGCTATFANDDKYPDVYLSALNNANSLYINQGASGQNGFSLAGSDVGIGPPLNSFPCWSFDFDNNGYEDLYVSSYNDESTPSTFWMQSHMGTVDHAMLSKLYSHTGNMEYRDVGVEMGLTEVAFTMGCNFGDINTDGFLDFYLGTGNPLFQSLVPNKMYLNMEGKRFEDVSYAGGFSNVQKGHGVGFGDLDHDGDEDIYIVMGGAVDADLYFNCLFENPNPDNNNWVVLKFVGVTANKAAIGTRVGISIQENGQERWIHRVVSSGASFGGNSLALEVGLRKATSINKVVVQWPCATCPDQEFQGLNTNKAYEITEGMPTAKEMPYHAVKMHGTDPMHDHHMMQ